MILENKTVVITGVSRGIGNSLAKFLLERKCNVVGLGLQNPEIINANFLFIKTDVRKEKEVENAIKKIYNEFSSSIEILINNAGLGYFGLLENISTEQWKEMFEVNVNGIYYMCKNILPQMKQKQCGHIVNIASTAALEGMPMVSAYCATKWAVKGLSESLWRECRDEKIKITCIYPGSTKTDFFRNSPDIKPHNYMLMPDDIARNIIYILESPDNFHTVNVEIRPLQPKGPKKI